MDSLKCQVVMLPAKGTGAFAWTNKYRLIYLNTNIDFQQHLYLVSDRDIKEDDKIYPISFHHIQTAGEDNLDISIFKKIEATTDRSLGLPLIPQKWIEEIYVLSDGSIKEVSLDMVLTLDGLEPTLSYENDELGEVIILSIKDSWNREEVLDIMLKFVSEQLTFLQDHDWRDKSIEWFNQNY